MSDQAPARCRDGHELDRGFTLIELMVVVLIIAILLAIAIPSYLGARNTANARATEEDLRNALTVESVYFTNHDQVFGVASALQSLDPTITWVDATSSQTAAPSNSNTVDIVAVAGSPDFLAVPTDLEILAVGGDNNCYYLDDSSGQVLYGKYPATSRTCPTAEPTAGGGNPGMVPDATGTGGAGW